MSIKEGSQSLMNGIIDRSNYSLDVGLIEGHFGLSEGPISLDEYPRSKKSVVDENFLNVFKIDGIC